MLHLLHNRQKITVKIRKLMFHYSFPDVMMPSYAISKWNAVFFISYISTVLYVLMNLVIYSDMFS